MAFWSRLEERLLALQRDRPRMARYLQVAYWISNAFLLVGVLVIMLVVLGKWPF